MDNNQILKIYMTLGGVPYYLKYISNQYSSEQNIQALFFNDQAPLRDEFKLLFVSLFKNSKAYIEIIKVLSKKRIGYTRQELAAQLKLSVDGGSLSEKLEALEQASFIHRYSAFSRSDGEYFKLVDEFCLFYLTWVKRSAGVYLPTHWHHQAQSPQYKSWSGFSFESVCMKHINEIIKTSSLNMGGVVTSWRHYPKGKDEDGTQIDILADRDDGAITLYEVKLSEKPYKIDKIFLSNLAKKIAVFKQVTKTQKAIFMDLITANGIVPHKNQSSVINQVITLADLIS